MRDTIDMAREAGYMRTVHGGAEVSMASMDCLKAFEALVRAEEEQRYMQLFLDPENQPTQFGTATQEYREKEIQKVQRLLTEIAGIVRTKHLYGPEMRKLLELEAAIRARGETK